MQEREGFGLSGFSLIVVCLIGVIAGLACEGVLLGAETHGWVVVGVLIHALTLFLMRGFFQIAPNEAQVLQLFGRYAGTVRREGLVWTNPFYSRRRVSLRVRNFESGKLKVNDRDGNPIEIAAVIVWQVLDTAEAVFCVEDYPSFVHIQSESALRQMAQSYSYDGDDDAVPSLRSHGDQINNHLRDQIQERLAKAGVQVTEARISHLAYAQEIAQAMLQRQQASAIVAARTRIVQGAVGMVALALEQLREQGVVDLDEERKAAMVSNLLVVLCGERGTQPVLNTGTLHH